MINTKNITVPYSGDKYYFWEVDNDSIPHQGTVVEVIDFSDTYRLQSITSKYRNDEGLFTLLEYWNSDKTNFPNIYNKETDYFIAVEIPDICKEVVYFVRNVHNEWVSINFSNWWQLGLLDVTGERYKKLMDDLAKYDE